MKGKKKIWIAVLVFLVLVVLGAIFSVGQKEPEQVVPQPEPAPVPIPGRGAEGKVDIRKQQDLIEGSRESISLADVAGGSSTGTATRSFDGTKFLHTVAAYLPPPGAGEFYEGWLVSETEAPAFISTGRLGEVGGGQYALVFSSTRKLYAHNKVVVTLETRDDGRPETHILEGNF